jgi:hypothetical protein
LETFCSTGQAVFRGVNEIKGIQQPEKGSGKGSFVVIKAEKDEHDEKGDFSSLARIIHE